MKSSLKSKEKTLDTIRNAKRLGKKIVFTNGCFDILHLGHLRYLEFAKNLGDILVVGLNSDASVKRIKGESRPIVPQDERAEMLLGLRPVDYVIIFEEDDPKKLISEVMPDFLVKGEDWAHNVVGRELVEENGGKVVLAKLVEGRSTTDIIKKIISQAHPTGKAGKEAR